MQKLSLILILCLITSYSALSQVYSIKEITDEYIKVELNFNGIYYERDSVISGKQYRIISGEGDLLREKGEPWIPQFNFSVGLPFGAEPTLKILSSNQKNSSNIFILPMPEEDPAVTPFDINKINKDIYSDNSFFPSEAAKVEETYVMRYARVLPVSVSPYQYNPVKRELVFNSRIVIQINFNRNYQDGQFIQDDFTDEYLEASVINSSQAKLFKGRILSDSPLNNSYWYDPNKTWHKIYLKEKDVYRITFEYLLNAGISLGSGIPSSKIELYNNGAAVPVDIVDQGDSIFNSGDYFQFVGYPPSPSAHSKLNIYTRSNVYWLSLESEGNALRYETKLGYPKNYDRTFQNSLTTIHFEKDSIFERLGHAPNDSRDYWFWGRAEKRGTTVQGFQERFSSFKDFNVLHSNLVTVRINMHGMTTSIYCAEDHKAEIEITGQPIGEITWDGQNAATFEKQIYVSEDSIKIYPEGNDLTVWLRGTNCGNQADEIRVNWFEFDYWRANNTGDHYFDFKNSEPYSGVNRYWLFGWPHDSMKIYIPERAAMMTDAQILRDEFNSVLFVDTVYKQFEYFCLSYDHHILPDSIVRDIPSDLRSLSNGADYIIITHDKFLKIAEDLAVMRGTSFPDKDIPNPRIKIVSIDQIYDEFSFGMLNPFAVKDFVKYTFEKWISPAPLYVVLIGDMSFDYRKLIPNSRPSYIPSIPFHSIEYGQAASDNMFVAVSGNDATPDMAIGRISIETLQEGEILLDKYRNYPSDPGKEWKQNVLLLASGLNEEDENKFGFNDASMGLHTRYLEPNGINSTKVFRYPNRQEYIPFRGEGPQIRKAISDGTVLVNYYGHGGGYQWDLVFLNDDIYLLENGGRLPIISSVTCYTAHFDNQDVFGEQFIKVPGKGAIGFWGSSGVTLWGIGNYINDLFFNEVFFKKQYVVGKAILKAKRQVSSIGYYTSQIALLTYLGDPVMKLALPEQPDFAVKSNGISISPEQPLAGDSVSVKILMRNLGIKFPGDSINVELYAESVDTSYTIGISRIPAFGEADSIFFSWFPVSGGLYQITVKVNETESIEEPDHSDNVATASFAVFDLNEPNIVKPYNGFVQSGNKVQFLFSDIGYFVGLDLKYLIEIDSSFTFNSPVKMSSGEISPDDGALKWTSNDISFSPVYWRSRIVNGTDSSRWSQPRLITLKDSIATGFYAQGKSFKYFPSYNLLYSEADTAMVLNTLENPPRPSNSKFIEAMPVPSEVSDEINLTTLTSDGTYFYTANMWYFSLGETNPEGKSYIYKIGTGYNGTTKGEYYGKLNNIHEKILNQIFWYPDGHIYFGNGNPYYLKRYNLQNETIDSVFIPDGILNWETAKPTEGAVYISTDGNLVYNLTLYDSLGNIKSILRTFDPSNGWSLTREDLPLHGKGYGTQFTGFYVYEDYIYTHENWNSGFMRRYRLSDGFFEEEWITGLPFKSFYAWVPDPLNNKIYATNFRSSDSIFVFTASYLDANGDLTISDIGPASNWDKINYSIENNSVSGSFETTLLGYNKGSRLWDTIAVSIPSEYDLSSIHPETYPYLRIKFNLMDSSFQIQEPLKIKSLHVSYNSLPEIQMTNRSFKFEPDSILQGFDMNMRFNIKNIGYVDADSVILRFFMNEEDSLFYTTTLSVQKDSSAHINYEFNTSNFRPASVHNIRVTTEFNKPEFFNFNNIAANSFYLSRDSLNPSFRFAIDGKEIINGDIVSAKPEIVISLKDNGPLPLKKEDFTLVYKGNQVNFDTAGVQFTYTPYPNSEAVITWKPVLNDGKHNLEILAKDASGNFFDSTSAKIFFYVFNTFDLQNVYNYPNPFKSDTHFTFELHGDDKKLEEFRIKLYTIAGRLIREFDIDPTSLQAGFNKVHWDGRDQDGDEVGNGVYLYKVITKNDGITKTTIQKLAKMK